MLGLPMLNLTGLRLTVIMLGKDILGEIPHLSTVGIIENFFLSFYSVAGRTGVIRQSRVFKKKYLCF